MTSTSFLGVTGLVEYQTNGTDRSAGVYYFAQNLQSSSNRLHFVPVLQYSEDQSWEKLSKPSTIVWPNYSCIVPSNRPILAGVTLRIAIIRLVPFAMLTREEDIAGKNQTKLTGYWPDLIELLRNKINFIPNVILTRPNTAYKDLLQAVVNGTYDILVGDVTITAERSELISFSESTFDTSLTVIIKKPISIDVDLFSYMKPFSTELWISIFATIIYASILMYLLERQQNIALRNRSSLSMGLMSVWYCIGTIMGYGADFQAVTASGRLLTLALYMLSLILVATYTANLASNLTKLVPKFVVNGTDDIRKGKVSPHRIGLIRASAMEQYYLREISRDNRNFYSASTRQDILDRLLNNTIDATILDSSVAEYLTNNIYCNLTLIGSTFNDGAFGIVMPKNWPYAQELDKNILELRESSQLERLRRKWFQTQKCHTLEEISTAIRIESMAGLFLIFGIITLLTLVPFI